MRRLLEGHHRLGLVRRGEASIEYLAAIDDTGSSEGAVTWAGEPIPGASRFCGLAAVVIRQDLVDEFEGRWNHLRTRIQKRLGCADPPPIHLRLMWGKNPADKDTNPYAAAKFKDIREWMLDAVNLLEAFQRKPGQLGVVIAFADREEFTATQSRYFKDPAFEPEMRFLQAQNRGRYKKLYDRYHRRITSPVAYCLPEILWKLNAAIESVEGTAVHVRFDRFADARGIDADEVLQVTRVLAGYDRIASLREIDTHYSDSPLCQAADLMAWTHNRFFTEQNKPGGPTDVPFDRIFSQMHRRLKVLNGGPFHASARLPATSTHDLCVAYALARASVADRHPEFAEEHLVSVEEFHKRHVATAGKASGVSVLTESARAKLLSGVPK